MRIVSPQNRNSKSKVMTVGATGSKVQDLETKLKTRGYLKGKADGTFDAKTATAVSEFKKDHGWKGAHPAGVVGSKLTDRLHLKGTFKAGATSEPTKGSETPRSMKGGTYNCLRDRDPNQVKKVVSGFLKQGKLDFLQVQEIQQYHKALNSIPGYHLVTFPGSRDHGESGVLVRDGLKESNKESIQSTKSYFTQSGSVAQPRAATAVKLAGWLNVASVHSPPAIDFVNGHAVGPERRVESYIDLSKHMVAYAKTHKGESILFGGDWNEGSRSTGVGSPSWIAEQAGMKKSGNGRIDWAMAKGAKILNMKTGPHGGSDHRLVTYTVQR